MKVSAYVDAIDSDIARLILEENEIIVWPARLLPEEVEPGSWVMIQISEDETKKKEEMSEILKLREELMESKYD